MSQLQNEAAIHLQNNQFNQQSLANIPPGSAGDNESLNITNAAAWNEKGITHYNRREYDEAVQCFDEAIRLDPELALAWNNKGSALYLLGKYTEAIRCYDEAIRLDPELALAWDSKGSALYYLGKYTEAIRAYDEAIKLDPEYAQAQDNRDLAIQTQVCITENAEKKVWNDSIEEKVIWFVPIEVPANVTRLGLSLTWDEPDNNLALLLFDQTGNPVGVSYHSYGVQETEGANYPTPGTWKAMVYGYNITTKLRQSFDLEAVFYFQDAGTGVLATGNGWPNSQPPAAWFTGEFFDETCRSSGVGSKPDLIVIGIEVEVQSPGSYEVAGRLVDDDGFEIERTEVAAALDEGVQIVSLSFNPIRFVMKKTPSRLHLKDLELSKDGEVVKKKTEAWSTEVYSPDEFTPAKKHYIIASAAGS